MQRSAAGAAAPPAESGKVLATGDDVVEHLLGEFAGEGVLLTRVVTADHVERLAVRLVDDGDLTVPEFRLRRRYRATRPPNCVQCGVPAETAERDDGAHPRQQLRELGVEPARAAVALVDTGLVVGRCAAHRRD